MADIPASPPKTFKIGRGLPKGRTGTPATRHPVIKKAAWRHARGKNASLGRQRRAVTESWSLAVAWRSRWLIMGWASIGRGA
jgi:hypothetical protein